MREANAYAVDFMGCPEPPPMLKSTVGKMGLKGVPGLERRVATAGVGRRVPWGGRGAGRGGGKGGSEEVSNAVDLRRRGRGGGRGGGAAGAAAAAGAGRGITNEGSSKLVRDFCSILAPSGRAGHRCSRVRSFVRGCRVLFCVARPTESE